MLRPVAAALLLAGCPIAAEEPPLDTASADVQCDLLPEVGAPWVHGSVPPSEEFAFDDEGYLVSLPDRSGAILRTDHSRAPSRC